MADGVNFRLSIWKPFRVDKTLNYSDEVRSSSESYRFDTEHLLEEIYYWHPGQEDPWTCFQQSDALSTVRTVLLEPFDPSVSPNMRSMSNFQRAVQSVRIAFSNSAWGDAVQTVRTARDHMENLRANGALSLLLHFDWIVRTFISVPRASVSIR